MIKFHIILLLLLLNFAKLKSFLVYQNVNMNVNSSLCSIFGGIVKRSRGPDFTRVEPQNFG